MLLYNLDHGEAEGHVIRMAAQEGLPLPKEIENAPRLLPGLGVYFGAFMDLRSCAEADGPIPWTATRQWADENELEPAQRRALFHHMRALDRAFGDWRSKKEKAHAVRVQQAGKRHGKAR